MSKDNIQLTPGSVKKAAQGASSSDLWKWPIDGITVLDGFNVRDKDADYKARVRSIADSIKINGYMADKPLAGYVAEIEGVDTLVLTDGHTRYDAIKLAISEGADIAHVPVVTKPRGTSMEDITIALVTSNSGERLKPLEVARVCKRLIGYGMDEYDIATRLGFTRAYVVGMLDMLAAPADLRKMVSTGKVSATEAMKAVKTHGGKATEVLKKAVEESGKDRVTAKDIKKVSDKPHPMIKKSFNWLVESEMLKNPDVVRSIMSFVSFVSGADESMVKSEYEKLYKQHSEKDGD